MTSLQAIFQQAEIDTSAHYTVAGVTYARIQRLPAFQGQADHPSTAHPTEIPPSHFRLRLLHGSLAGTYEGTQLELVTLLASTHPPIPTQRGWRVGTPPPDDLNDLESPATPSGDGS